MTEFKINSNQDGLPSSSILSFWNYKANTLSWIYLSLNEINTINNWLIDIQISDKAWNQNEYTFIGPRPTTVILPHAFWEDVHRINCDRNRRVLRTNWIEIYAWTPNSCTAVISWTGRLVEQGIQHNSFTDGDVSPSNFREHICNFKMDAVQKIETLQNFTSLPAINFCFTSLPNWYSWQILIFLFR